MTSVSESRRSNRRVLRMPEIITWTPSILRIRAIGMKIRCRANSSTTRPLTRGARFSVRRWMTTSRTRADLVTGIIEDRQIRGSWR